MAITFDDLVSKCDVLIKSGKIDEVSAILSEVNLARVPRIYRGPLAKICRRSGLIDKGLRLLFPVIRSEKENDDTATPTEVCEYAVLLSRNGSIREALELLNQLDSKSIPEVLLYQGFCYVSCWDYRNAAVLFEKFLNTNVDSYSKLIARVNLASAYLALGEITQAHTFLTETIAIAIDAKATRLIGNCYELRGQAHILAENFPDARQDLAKALGIFGEAQSYDQLLILKWQSVMQATEEKTTHPLLKFREEAWNRGHWESVREADLFALKIHFDQRKFDHLVIGTAAPNYRDRIQRILNHTPSSSYTLGDSQSIMRLNLESGKLLGASDLNPGRKIHQALAALTRDFYVPRNVGTLFAELYPEEFFNVESSPTRVRQILRRTRRWFEENEIPASIDSSEVGYRFVIHASFALEVPLFQVPIQSQALRWQELKKTLARPDQFTAGDACKSFGISISSFHRLAEWAQQAGELKVTGIGKATRYQTLNSQSGVLKKVG